PVVVVTLTHLAYVSRNSALSLGASVMESAFSRYWHVALAYPLLRDSCARVIKYSLIWFVLSLLETKHWNIFPTSSMEIGSPSGVMKKSCGNSSVTAFLRLLKFEWMH